MELSNESSALDVYMHQVNRNSKLLTKEEEYERQWLLIKAMKKPANE